MSTINSFCPLQVLWSFVHLVCKGLRGPSERLHQRVSMKLCVCPHLFDECGTTQTVHVRFRQTSKSTVLWSTTCPQLDIMDKHDHSLYCELQRVHKCQIRIKTFPSSHLSFHLLTTLLSNSWMANSWMANSSSQPAVAENIGIITDRFFTQTLMKTSNATLKC